jgi:hypothetical protein
MAAWRRAIELPLGDEDAANPSSPIGAKTPTRHILNQ